MVDLITNESSILNPQKSMKQIRFTSVNTSGSLNILGEIIKNHGIEISAQDIMRTMPKYLDNFTDLQKNVFKAYFLRQSSVFDIYTRYEFDLVQSAEKLLSTTILEYIEMLKKDYKSK